MLPSIVLLVGCDVVVGICAVIGADVCCVFGGVGVGGVV